MTEELEKEAERFVSEKSDKGNFDIEQFGKAYFSESSMKQALVKFTEQRKVRTEIEINGVRFSSISDMLQYMGKLRDHIIDLEKENTKLKDFINVPLTKGRTTTRKEMFQSIWELSKKLSAAKDLLKRWVDDRVYTVSEQKDLIADTEQFLKEE